MLAAGKPSRRHLKEIIMVAKRAAIVEVVAVDRENRTDLHSKRIVARGFRTFESDVDESRIEA